MRLGRPLAAASAVAAMTGASLIASPVLANSSNSNSSSTPSSTAEATTPPRQPCSAQPDARQDWRDHSGPRQDQRWQQLQDHSGEDLRLLQHQHVLHHLGNRLHREAGHRRHRAVRT